jgi:hypothetical protein
LAKGRQEWWAVHGKRVVVGSAKRLVEIPPGGWEWILCFLWLLVFYAGCCRHFRPTPRGDAVNHFPQWSHCAFILQPLFGEEKGTGA